MSVLVSVKRLRPEHRSSGLMGSQVYRLDVAPRKKTQTPTGPAPPPMLVPTLHDFHDVTSAEAKLG